ncbi:MAG: type I methionyl aminopeptidase [Patescibacteria group bacterium]|nr:type I methionyl aminopeptidase [Patescibacteria group bacterium]
MAYVTKKSAEEIAILAEGGRILSEALKAIRERAVPGSGTEDLEMFARAELAKRGAEPSFLNYRPSGEREGYPGAICISINEEIVHGLSVPNRVLRKGDLVSLDFGAKYKGLFTDMAVTFYLGRPPQSVRRLIAATRQALRRAVKTVRPGAYLGDIGRTIERHATRYGFGIVRDLTGHGVGYAVHESPRVPNYDDPSLSDILLEPGMCLAIEPMLTMGDHRIKTRPDGWTIVAADGNLSAHAEVTVVVTERGRKVITPFID